MPGIHPHESAKTLVILGHDGKNEISIKHRWLILKYDWLPMTVGLGFLCAIFGGIILSVPAFISGVAYVFWLCVFCCLVPFGAAISLLVGTIWEYQFMKEILCESMKVSSATFE